MRLLQSGVDITVIALWLGHEQTSTAEIYLHADIARSSGPSPVSPRPGRHLAATGHPTRYWPSSKPSDYADLITVEPLTTQAIRPEVGIIDVMPTSA